MSIHIVDCLFSFCSRESTVRERLVLMYMHDPSLQTASFFSTSCKIFSFLLYVNGRFSRRTRNQSSAANTQVVCTAKQSDVSDFTPI